MTVRIGAAHRVITPERDTQIQGAGIPNQPAQTAHDRLEANALYLEAPPYRMLRELWT